MPKHKAKVKVQVKTKSNNPNYDLNNLFLLSIYY